MAFRKIRTMGGCSYQSGGDGINFDFDRKFGYRVMSDISGFSVPASEITMGTGIREGLLISRQDYEKYDEQLIIEPRSDDISVPYSRVRDQDYQ